MNTPLALTFLAVAVVLVIVWKVTTRINARQKKDPREVD